MRLTCPNLPRPEKCRCESPALSRVTWPEVTFVECGTCCAIDVQPTPEKLNARERRALLVAFILAGLGLVLAVARLAWGGK